MTALTLTIPDELDTEALGALDGKPVDSYALQQMLRTELLDVHDTIWEIAEAADEPKADDLREQARRLDRLADACAELNPAPTTNRLRDLRDMARLSRGELAEQVGVPGSTLREWEAGGSIPDEHAEKLSAIFAVSVRFLLAQDLDDSEA